MMFKRRSIWLLLAGAVVFMSSAVCGYSATSAPLPAPAEGLKSPSPASAPQSTEASAPPSLPITVQPSATAGAASEPPPVVRPAIPESRRVTLEFPPHIRVGDSDIVRLTLEVDTLGNITPTAETQGNEVVGKTVQVPNLYQTHNVLAEARLDLAGVDIRPGDLITEPLLPGQSVTFYWSVHPGSPGTYRGTVWLFLRFIDKVTKEESRIPLSAQTVEISTMDLFGLSGGLARTAGGVGSVVGGVLGLPFVTDVLKWLWNRVRQRA